MSLRDYARKRSFDATPEPSAESRPRRRRAGAPIFVVQLHHARARHYDFRLEADGALKSWAVPKGPSMRAGERRLAVQVEDHPLDYAAFEGEIPEGQYGAGHVALFDRGTWAPEGDALERIAAGRLDFALAGTRLRGRFTLVRTASPARQPQWLLIKRSDEYAGDTDADAMVDAPPPATPSPAASGKRAAKGTAKAARTAGRRVAGPGPAHADWTAQARALPGAAAASMPRGIEPQLATLRTRPPVGEGWLHEVKWDGYRLLAYRDEAVELCSRNHLPWAPRLPHLVQALAELPVREAVVDGELVAIDDRGRSDFGLLQRLLERGDTTGLRLVAFDLLHIDGIDLRGVAQVERRRLLAALVARAASPALAFSAHVEGDAAAVLEASARAGLEGIVCKRADAPYRSGRHQAWIKLKHVADESFLVVGHTRPRNGRHGFGSLLLAQRRRGGLQYVGRVGSGFGDASLRMLARRLQALHADAAQVELPAHVPFSPREVRWVRPELVVDVHTRGRGKEGLVRQASFVRVREDLDARGLGPRSPRAAPRQENDMAASRLSSPERVVYPDAGITKQDVADYYTAVAAWLLPELADRPLSLLRCPDGVEGQCFFQKHHRDSLGPGVHPVLLDERDGQDEYLYVRDIEGVLSLVQMNAIEFHPWGAKRTAPDRPDRLVFDLDPADELPWAEVKRAAREVRDRLAQVGLRSWPRLSGGKGIHVCVPIAPGPGWDTAKDFCEAFAKAMVAQSPLRYVAVASKQARRGRIFIDWLRNGRGATSVAGWALRARAGAPVAMPLRWEELSRTASAAEYGLARARQRAARLRSDPWDGFAALRQALPGS
ncbi:DNA ligase D [Pseudoxanthomonas broegbernensis]|uniref:DNA ligase (ATP) n=1 Tax=Pseudoxanthomonas broegbernensis TaxID=83619 RepID=A0A7V8GME0_9GAMM|nr:DNA ligase D [Pseudoxanthomonas broegbernensis]KAF1686337.1 DNA ligase D [Pseudoxanthomonas broegbernensis]MBB6064027.1 bifunctional non-homologous end joining protein LigD [Pseudoxanthomonas broegbernensis]